MKFHILEKLIAESGEGYVILERSTVENLVDLGLVECSPAHGNKVYARLSSSTKRGKYMAFPLEKLLSLEVGESLWRPVAEGRTPKAVSLRSRISQLKTKGSIPHSRYYRVSVTDAAHENGCGIIVKRKS